MGKSKDLATRVGIDDNADATAITITSQENVGIGTASPSNYGAAYTSLGVSGSSASAIEGFVGSNLVGYLQAYNTAVLVGSKTNVPLKLVTNDTIQMTIDGSGRVTIPSQPQFVLQGSFNNFTTITQAGAWLPFTGATGNAQSSGGVIAMNWTSSRSGGYNPTGNGFNATTGVYTAPVTGTYMFTFNAYLNKPTHSGGEYVHINSYINGANQDDYTIYGYMAGSGSYQSPEITKVIRMATNDTFGFRLYSNVASSFKIYPHYTCIAGYLLG